MNDIIENGNLPPERIVPIPAQPGAVTPADMIMYAMKNGGTMDQIRELIALKREMEADEARKASVSDMAEF